MPSGFAGQILRVDLTTGSCQTDVLDETLLRRYLGGGPLGVYYLLRETPAGQDPLDPAAPLLLMTSAMNGSALSGANRWRPWE